VPAAEFRRRRRKIWSRRKSAEKQIRLAENLPQKMSAAAELFFS
jgi:hypothetical protein